jgi:hypothetical protein
MESNDKILNNIRDFGDKELSELQVFIDYIKFKRRNTICISRESLLKLLKSKGFDNIEVFVRRIKEAPFDRTEYGYINGILLKKWVSVTLELSDEQSLDVIKLVNSMGLLLKSSGNNYR